MFLDQQLIRLPVLVNSTADHIMGRKAVQIKNVSSKHHSLSPSDIATAWGWECTHESEQGIFPQILLGKERPEPRLSAPDPAARSDLRQSLDQRALRCLALNNVPPSPCNAGL